MATGARASELGRRLLVLLSVALASGCPSCLDLKTGREYPCELNASSAAPQCPAQFRCGLESYCHPVGVAAAYACEQDSDCEAGWRCSASSHRCVDPANETLQELGYAGLLELDAVWPRFPSKSATGLSATPVLPTPVGLAGLSYRTVAVAEGDTTELGMALQSGGATLGFVAAQFSQPGGVRALGSAQNGVYTVLPDGGVEHLELSFVAGPPPFHFDVTPTRTPVPVPATSELRVLDSAGGLVALWTNPAAGGISLLEADGGISALPVPGPVADLTGDRAALYALTTDGRLWVAPAAGAFTELPTPAFGPAACADGGTLYQPLHLYHSDAGLLVESTLAGETIAGHGPYAAAVAIPSTPSGSCEEAAVLGPCRICPAGSVALTLATDADGNLAAVCTPAPGRATQLFHVRRVTNALGQTRCTDPEPYRPSQTTTSVSSLYRDALIPARVSQGVTPLLGLHGQIWFSPEGDFGVAQPLFQDRAPELLTYFRGQTPGGAVTGRLTFADGVVFLDNGIGFSQVDVQGLDGGAVASATVEGNAEWVVASAGVEDLSNQSLVAVVAPGGDAPKRPYNAITVPLPDGGLELVVSAFDSILAADVTAQADSAVPVAPAFLEVRSVPAPRLPILAITATPGSADAGSLFEGYALTASGAQHFVALTQERWRLTEVPVPEGTALKLWSDEGRARVGYRDGTVYSLPGLVKLAEPLLGGGAAVSDYARYCGRIHALTPAGLFRLDATDGPEGVWTPLNDALPNQGAVDGIAGGRLFPLHIEQTVGSVKFVSDELHVATSYGQLLMLRTQSGICP